MSPALTERVSGGHGGDGAAAPGILCVQAEARQRPMVGERLARLGAPVVMAHDAAEALRVLVDTPVQVCVVDLADDRSALTAIRLLRARHAGLPMIGIVDPANPASAAEALTAGVPDLLPWPFSDEDIATLVEHARERAASAAASAPAPAAVQSPSMRDVMAAVTEAATSRQGVCLYGESGVGLDEVARALHTTDRTGLGAFVQVECGSQSPAELEVLLFGDAAGRDDRAADELDEITADAAVARARNGTLLLANAGDAPARVQMRLARILRDGEAVIDGHRVDLNIRLVVSLDVSRDVAVREGRLRRDLVDRLVHNIEVPPLRRRAEDLPLLAARLLETAARRHGTPARSFSRSTLSLLAALPWPGNMVEFAAVVDAVARDGRRPVVQIEDVLAHVRLDTMATRIDPGLTLREARLRFERECITAALRRHHGRMGDAARALGIQRTNLYRKVRQLKLSRVLLTGRL